MTGFDDDELRKLLAEADQGIDIAPEGDEAGSGVEPDYLRFGRNKIPLGDDELKALERLVKRYVEEFGLNHGFARWLCDGRAAPAE